MKHTTIEKITLVAQLVLTLVLVVGFFWMFFIAWMSNTVIQPERLRVIDTMVGSLGSMATMSVAYWMARQRNASADRDPEAGQ